MYPFGCGQLATGRVRDGSVPGSQQMARRTLVVAEEAAAFEVACQWHVLSVGEAARRSQALPSRPPPGMQDILPG